MCICMYICIHTHIYIYIYIYAHAVSTFRYIHKYIHKHVHIYTHVCLYIYKHTGHAVSVGRSHAKFLPQRDYFAVQRKFSRHFADWGMVDLLRENFGARDLGFCDHLAQLALLDLHSSVLQCVAVRCSVLVRFFVTILDCWPYLIYILVCCSVLQCLANRCRVCCRMIHSRYAQML